MSVAQGDESRLQVRDCARPVHREGLGSDRAQGLGYAPRSPNAPRIMALWH